MSSQPVGHLLRSSGSARIRHPVGAPSSSRAAVHWSVSLTHPAALPYCDDVKSQFQSLPLLPCRTVVSTSFVVAKHHRALSHVTSSSFAHIEHVGVVLPKSNTMHNSQLNANALTASSVHVALTYPIVL